MNHSEEIIEITSADYWFKVVDFLQHNWALIDDVPVGGVVVWFFGDTSGVFDNLQFESADAARDALQRNGFSRHADNPQAQQMARCPSPPFHHRPHPNGPIYSSGRFWK